MNQVAKQETRDVDFHAVHEEHEGSHARFLNWADWLRSVEGSRSAPIWLLGRSNGRSWYEPVIRPNCDILDAQHVEKMVALFPENVRYAVRWCYVWKTTPAKPCRAMGVQHQQLFHLIERGRQLLGLV